jgi:hypothetical protein
MRPGAAPGLVRALPGEAVLHLGQHLRRYAAAHADRPQGGGRGGGRDGRPEPAVDALDFPEKGPAARGQFDPAGTADEKRGPYPLFQALDLLAESARR